MCGGTSELRHLPIVRANGIDEIRMWPKCEIEGWGGTYRLFLVGDVYKGFHTSQMTGLG